MGQLAVHGADLRRRLGDGGVAAREDWVVFLVRTRGVKAALDLLVEEQLAAQAKVEIYTDPVAEAWRQARDEAATRVLLALELGGWLPPGAGRFETFECLAKIKHVINGKCRSVVSRGRAIRVDLEPIFDHVECAVFHVLDQEPLACLRAGAVVVISARFMGRNTNTLGFRRYEPWPFGCPWYRLPVLGLDRTLEARVLGPSHASLDSFRGEHLTCPRTPPCRGPKNYCLSAALGSQRDPQGCTSCQCECHARVSRGA